MKKLIEFYEDEMGSDSDMSDNGRDDDTSVDSLSSASENEI